jgi:hypothetical protein
MQIYIKYESLANFSNIVANACEYEPLRLHALSAARQAVLGFAVAGRLPIVRNQISHYD